MNILHLTPDFNYGDGRSYYVYLLLKYFHRAGHNVYLCTNKGDSYDRVTESGIGIFSFTSLSGKGDKSKIYDLLKKNSGTNFNEPEIKNVKEKLLFWIEYFYGSKSRSQKHFSGDISLRQSIAFLNSFLPASTFSNIIKSRLGKKLLTTLKEKSKHKAELKKLVNA